MVDKDSVPKNFNSLLPEDTDLVMFQFQELTLVKRNGLVVMTMVLKRKIVTELLTTYLPTILLLLISFVTIFFDKHLFGDAIAVNLTIMLVMTTIFTSKIEELPPTSDMKMIDIWLIFCLVVPFLEVVIRTGIECVNCSCHIFDHEETGKDTCKAETNPKKIEDEPIQALSTGAWVHSSNSVAPEKVVTCIGDFNHILLSQSPIIAWPCQ